MRRVGPAFRRTSFKRDWSERRDSIERATLTLFDTLMHLGFQALGAVQRKRNTRQTKGEVWRAACEAVKIVPELKQLLVTNERGRLTGDSPHLHIIRTREAV